MGEIALSAGPFASRITRRQLGRIFGALAVAASGLVRSRPSLAGIANRNLTVYAFDPFAIDAVTGMASCVSCSACLKHAQHKLFSSFEVADSKRAHPHCRCAIRPISVSAIQFAELFGAPETVDVRGEFDFRQGGPQELRVALGLGGLEMPAVR